MGRIKINWLEAFQEYLSVEVMSLGDIAKKYNISLSRVKKVSMNEKWKQKKELVWMKAKKIAITEAESFAREMTRRHSDTARYLQKVGLDGLKKLLETKKPLRLTINVLLKMVVLGLKTERDLFPGEVIADYFRTKPRVNDELKEVSPELLKAAHEALVRNITQSPH